MRTVAPKQPNHKAKRSRLDYLRGRQTSTIRHAEHDALRQRLDDVRRWGWDGRPPSAEFPV
jgi:hypothetical protein